MDFSLTITTKIGEEIMNFYECELQTNDIAAIKLVLECLRVKKKWL